MASCVLTIAHGHPDIRAGGAEIAAYQLHRGLSQSSGVRAVFLAAAGGAVLDREAGVQRHRGRPDEYLLTSSEFDHFHFLQRSNETIAAYTHLLSEIRPDIVHFHHYSNIGVELIRATRAYKKDIRIVFTLHEFLAICHHYGLMVTRSSFHLCDASSPALCSQCFPDRSPQDFALRKRRLLHFFAEVDLFIAPSRFLRERYIEWGLPAGQILVQPNGTGTGAMPISQSIAEARPPNRFAFFGQIHPFKGLVPLLRAFGRLASLESVAARGGRLAVNGAHLELNDPSYVAKVHGLLARLGERATFSGPYTRSELTDRMACVDWVVVPSLWWENAPLVIEEALAHGRPVLCSDLGGMKEAVRPGLDGFHFPAGDWEALAQLLARVAGDSALWRGLRSTLRTPTTIADAVSQHLELYHDASFRFAEPKP